jgi:hypothetical protein
MTETCNGLKCQKKAAVKITVKRPQWLVDQLPNVNKQVYSTYCCSRCNEEYGSEDNSNVWTKRQYL